MSGKKIDQHFLPHFIDESLNNLLIVVCLFQVVITRLCGDNVECDTEDYHHLRACVIPILAGRPACCCLVTVPT